MQQVTEMSYKKNVEFALMIPLLFPMIIVICTTENNWKVWYGCYRERQDKQKGSLYVTEA